MYISEKKTFRDTKTHGKDTGLYLIVSLTQSRVERALYICTAVSAQGVGGVQNTYTVEHKGLCRFREKALLFIPDPFLSSWTTSLIILTFNVLVLLKINFLLSIARSLLHKNVKTRWTSFAYVKMYPTWFHYSTSDPLFCFIWAYKELLDSDHVIYFY